jgi:hypothetical protein
MIIGGCSGSLMFTNIGCSGSLELICKQNSGKSAKTMLCFLKDLIMMNLFMVGEMGAWYKNEV